MPGWPRILWDFEGGLDDAHLQNLKIARRESFQSVKRCFFTRPVMTLCEPVIVIFIYFYWNPLNDCSQFEYYFTIPKYFFATQTPSPFPKPSWMLVPFHHPQSSKKCSNNKCLHKKLIEKSSKLTFAGLSTLHAPPIAIFYNPRCVYPPVVSAIRLSFSSENPPNIRLCFGPLLCLKHSNIIFLLSE